LKSEEIKARAERYSRVEKAADTMGRLIGVRRLKPSDEMRLTGLTPDLDGFESGVGSDGETIRIAKRAPFAVAAMVCEIDGIPFTFPKTRGELDAVYDRLDREGVEAAMAAYIKMEGHDKPDEEADEGIIDKAKNSRRTSVSGK
jgi:hypothetical protein